MTANEFAAECVSRLILPEAALEDDEITQALRDRDDERVKLLLDTNF